MRHEMLTQRARFCIGVMAKKGTLSQHFVTHVVPPLPIHYSSALNFARSLYSMKGLLLDIFVSVKCFFQRIAFMLWKLSVCVTIA